MKVRGVECQRSHICFILGYSEKCPMQLVSYRPAGKEQREGVG